MRFQHDKKLLSTILVFTDLDGTLLDHDTYSLAPARELIDTLQECKIPLVANTSKTRAELLSFQKSIMLQAPFISENGAAIHLPKTQFPRQPQNSVESGEFWVKQFSQPRAHWISLLKQLAPELQNLTQPFSQMSVEQLCQETGLTFDNGLLAHQREYGEPLKWLGSEDEKHVFIDKITAQGGHVLQGGRFIHIGDQVNKGDSMIWLKDLYNQTSKQNHTTIALGDSHNDIDMLEAADVAVLVKSPVHQFPPLRRTTNIIKTQNKGPVGWVEGLLAGLDILNNQGVSHG
ncbi:MAG: HAD-IIB family hydrolase [Desulfobulbaceae bacterium]|nr:MAG: HAD-IIB family hydrolase [Desulfobulbaceae bacterium]